MNDVKAHGAKALALKTDVCNPDENQQMVAKTVENFGRVDILINHAGGRQQYPQIPYPLISGVSN